MNNGTIKFQLLSLGIQAQLDSDDAPPVCIHGMFGIGKNKGGVELIAQQLLLSLVYNPATRFDAAEFNGYPVKEEATGTMRYYAPHWAHRCRENTKKHLVFFDEASDAVRSTQGAMHGVLTDGNVGEISIKGTPMVMAMNPPAIATTGGTLSGPMGTRVFQIEWTADIPDYARQLRSGGFDEPEIVKLPKGWENTIQASMMSVGQFLHTFSQHGCISEEEFVGRGEDGWKPSHCPRAWTHFYTLRAAAIASGQKHLLFAIAEGTVGAPGIEYLAWEKDLEFGDPELWLNNPHHQTFPADDDRVFAVINAVLSAVLQNNTPDRWNKGWEFLEFCRGKDFGDLAALGAPMLAKNRGKAKGIPAVAKNFFPMLKAAGLIGGE